VAGKNTQMRAPSAISLHTHVFDLGMERARDRDIWDRAVVTNSILITKAEA
jgi:predicted nuclease of predicted toxin-antitoxin system